MRIFITAHSDIQREYYKLGVLMKNATAWRNCSNAFIRQQLTFALRPVC